MAEGPRGLAALRLLLELRADPLAALTAAAQRWGDVVTVPFGRRTFVVLRHPAQVHHVFAAGERYTRETSSYSLVRNLLGDGIFTSDGARWRAHRRSANGAFQQQGLVDWAQATVNHAREMLERWQRAAAEGREVSLDEDLARLTIGVVGDGLIARDLRTVAGSISHDLTLVLDHFHTILNLPFPVRWIAACDPPLRAAIRRLDAHVRDMADSVRQAGASPLLKGSAHAAGNDPDYGGQRALLDNIMSMLMAGHETVKNSLQWALVLLAKHPRVAAALHDEARAVLDRGATATGCVAELGLTQRVVKEILRLHPPVWLIERRAVQDDCVLGVDVPAGSSVVLSPYLTHRHPQFWERPDSFEPDRFLDGGPRAPFAFFPFGGGAHRCIGERFGMAEMVLVLAHIARRFRVKVDQEVRPFPSITLRPGRSLRASLVPWEDRQ
jgi:cytochrome P450